MTGVRLVPHATLEASAHERYVRKYDSAPRPKIINIEALLRVTEPRDFSWGGVGYRAPPLTFLLATRIMVLAHALRDLRERGAPLSTRQAAVRVGAPLLARACPPIASWRRLLGGRRLFARGTPEDIEAICAWLLMVPDDGASPPPEKAVTLDLMDALADFVRQFPAWCDEDGFPLSWAHYVYGQRHAMRASHRADLKAAIATRAGQSDAKGYRDFERQWMAAAGWN